MLIKSDNAGAVAYSKTIESLYKIESIKGLKDKICLDLGAHVGIFSLRVAELTQCIIHAYEPHPENYQTLLYHISINGFQDRIIPFNYAVWKDEGEAELNLNGSLSDIHSLCDVSSQGKIKVKTVTPEKVFHRASGPIGYLKINCEGGEYYLLRYITEHKEVMARTDRICLELHPDLLKENWPEVVDMARYIKANFDKPLKITFGMAFTKMIDDSLMRELRIDTLCH